MEELIYGFKILTIGISVVFVALVAVALMLTLFSYINNLFTPQSVTEPAAPVSPPLSDGLTPEIVAVITAAVTTTLGQHARIKRIRYQRNEGTVWQTQGRSSIMSSHALERKSSR